MECIEHPAVTSIEQLRYLRTLKVSPVTGTLLEVHVAGGEVLDNPHAVAGIHNVRSISIPKKSDIYSFKFANFISYSVTDEMFIQTVTEEVFIGGRIRIYSKSHFLDCVSSATWATSEFPGRLLHFQLNTLDHTIDVVTVNPPHIEVYQD